MKSLRLLACWCVLGGLALSAQAYPPAYSAQAIQGQVVDDQTGQPLADVVVVTQWRLRMQKVLGLPGWDDYVGDASDILKSIETVTDGDGHYAIPAWGPLARPPLRYVGERDPYVVAFKGTYKPLAMLNQQKVSPEQSDRSPTWDGKVLRLKRAGSLEQQANEIRDIYYDLVRDSGTTPTPSLLCPRMLAAMQVEIKRLLSLGLPPQMHAGAVPPIERFNEPERAFLRSLQ